MGSPRKTKPPPLSLDTVGQTAAANYYDTPGSEKGKKRMSSYSSDYSNPGSPPSRKASDSSTISRRKASSPTVNVYTTCGRHTDQYLFGGRSLTDIARSVWGRNGN